MTSENDLPSLADTSTTGDMKWRPSAGQAAIFVAAAVGFALFRWWEHRWRLSRGDYPGIGLKHTWYWYAQPFLTLGALGIVVLITRWSARRHPRSRQ